MTVDDNEFLPDRLVFYFNGREIQNFSIAPATIGRWGFICSKNGEIPDCISIRSTDIKIGKNILEIKAHMGEYEVSRKWNIISNKNELISKFDIATKQAVSLS